MPIESCAKLLLIAGTTERAALLMIAANVALPPIEGTTDRPVLLPTEACAALQSIAGETWRAGLLEIAKESARAVLSIGEVEARAAQLQTAKGATRER